MTDTSHETAASAIYHFPEFFSRLEGRGALPMRDAVESETEIDGLLYHHRGVQVPADSAVFIWDPETEDVPVFRLEVAGVAGRTAWAAFDSRKEWDVYLARFDGGAIVAWMSDEEFARDESVAFDSKARAILAGRFSFGAFFLFGPDWVEREEWAATSTAPALLQFGDGSVVDPDSDDEFYELAAAIPSELHRDPAAAPAYLGLVDAGLEIHPHD